MLQRTAVITLGCLLLAAQAMAGDVVLRPVGPEARAALEARRAAGERAEATTQPGRVAAAIDTVGPDFLLPLYEVDVDGALTTLFAARNAFDVPNEVTVTYFDRFGTPIKSEVADIGPLGAVTRNVRDVTGLPVEGDGVRRGFAILSAVSELSGDFFRVDPVSNFASGDRLILLSEALCDVWDFRFLRGGPFSGGTDLVIFVQEPLGPDELLDVPSAIIEVFDEAGNFLGSVGLWTALVVNRVTADEILDAIASPAAAGIFDFFFDSLTDGGLVMGTYSAEGRYSIGMHGTCY